MSNAIPNKVFMHVAWMESYAGMEKQHPHGGGRFVQQNRWGGELFNFKNEGGYVSGYVWGPGYTINIDRLGADPDDEFIDDVLVVWTATHPGGGVWIVGWYEKATVFREYQVDDSIVHRVVNGESIQYSVRTKARDAWLLPPEERRFRIPVGAGWKGQSNVWYADKEHNQQFRREVWQYVQRIKSRPGKLLGRNRKLQAPERRCVVEQTAIKKVTEHYSRRGYAVSSVENDNVGWDLEATRGVEMLLLEVKGLSAGRVTLQLTPNEYVQAQRHACDYRICVVTNATGRKPMLRVFAYIDGVWRASEGDTMELQVEERTGATLTERQ